MMLIAALIATCLASATWYKGNTHAHTELCGHADSTPDAVARWYLDHGYHFLVLSEHNLFIDPSVVSLPEPRRSDFILIPGEEVTGARSVHMTALNARELVPWSFDDAQVGRIVQQQTDAILTRGGEPILNHPNFQDAVKAADVKPVERLHFFELFNGHPATQSFGSAKSPSTEQMWDQLLTHGLLVYAISSDDTHTLKRWGARESNPGRGWSMVRSATLTPAAITQAMRDGDFYASAGVILSELEIGRDHYAVAVDPAATARELSSPLVVGRSVDHGEAGWRIEFIGPGGAVLASHTEMRASHALEPAVAYVRARITFTRHQDERWEEFYAWTQPGFSDDRVKRVHEADSEWLNTHR